jgi:tetratricopeptide (TPR) repeat protein
MMTIPVAEKIYVILDKYDKNRLDGLCRGLWELFSHVNLTSNLYIVCKDISDGLPQVERIQKVVKTFLKENLFARIYVHFVHGLSLQAPSDGDYYFQYYYQSWKRTTLESDREGYRHQEIPRLVLLPVIVPQKDTAPDLLAALLGRLKAAFLMPGLYLDADTFSLAQNDGLRRNTEKLYFGEGDSQDPANVVRNLYYQGMVEDLTDSLGANTPHAEHACTPALIISARDGAVYRCVDTFVRGKGLASLFEDAFAATFPDRYARSTASKDRCLQCKERAMGFFARSPLPKEREQEVGALLYYFATLHQDSQNYVQAITNFESSLACSPQEEHGTIHFRIGLCHINLGDHDQALEALKKAQNTYHDEPFYHYYLGICFFGKADLSRALDAFSTASSLNPPPEDLVNILIYQGTCHNALGAYEKALIPLEKAKAMTAHVKEIFSTLGFSYFQLKDFDRAIENLKQAVALDPLSAVDYASLGANYREKGDRKSAIAMFKKALELEPSMDAAKQNLEMLINLS